MKSFVVKLVDEWQKGWVICEGKANNAATECKDLVCEGNAENEGSKKIEERPNLMHKVIKHRWECHGKLKWFNGTVINVYGENVYDSGCLFDVRYSSGVYQVRLMEDWLNGDVKILHDSDEPVNKKKRE